ncbi:facilitated trehalose transporter Tret1 [Procambarus clarkii]|uniref:facilitated trehalose transporter Tret1 n=1 Tax=Procambarus clarkii TaxID=6728 RepID=UPI001E670457|nr:facilitated trehalose transporter Tret1-like [Procambarus clarkii]
MSKPCPATSVTDLCVDKTGESVDERRRRHAWQMLLILGASVSYFVMGMSLSWPNVLASDLLSENSTLFSTHLQLDDWQMDMMGSILTIGSVPGFLVAGWMIGRLGRRWSLAVAVVPGLLGWAAIAFALDATMLIIGRFLDGITCGMVTLAVITYATEIPDTTHRGSVGTIVCFMFLIGTGIGVSLGIFLTWYEVAFINVGLLLLYIIAIVPCLPESPTFLAVNDKDKAAHRILERLRGTYADLDAEIKLLKQLNRVTDATSKWGALLSLENLKRISLLSCLFFIQNFSGTAVIRVNATRILEASGVNLDKDISTTILLVVPICGVFVLTSLVDRIGRRLCLVVSMAPMVVAYAILGCYVFLSNYQVTIVSFASLYSNHSHETGSIQKIESPENEWSWLPLGCLLVCIFAMNIGIESLPWHLSSELFPTTIRSQAMSVCTVVGSVFAAAALQLYSPMQSFLTPAGLYWTYAGVSALGIVFILLTIPETARQAVG